jgi:peroxiredoxin
MTEIGERVPELELRDDRGDPWRLDAERDRPLLLIFHRHFY